MNWKLTERKAILAYSIKCSLICWLVAHGYRMANMLLGHDALSNLVQLDVTWQRSLGRFAQSYLILFRGSLTSPWLLTAIAFLFLAASIFIVLEIFQIQDKRTIIAINAIMICNITMTMTNAAFMPWLDVYAIALFLSLLGSFLISRQKKISVLIGVASLVGSLSMYQAYVMVAMAVAVILLMLEILRAEDWKQVFKKALLFAGCFLATAVVYYAILKIVLLIHHIPMSNTYNGLSGLNDFSGVSIMGLIWQAITAFFHQLNSPGLPTSIRATTYHDILQRVVLVINVLVMLAIVVLSFLALWKKKSKPWKYVGMFVLCMAFPLAANFVYVLSKGMEHPLMTYSIQFLYVLMLVMAEENGGFQAKTKGLKAIAYAGVICVACLTWFNVVFSNQLYFRLDLQQRAMVSNMTRLVDEVEGMPEYIPGQTPVVMLGSFEKSSYIRENMAMSMLSILGTGQTSLTYQGLERVYVEYVLNRNMIWCDPDQSILDQAEKMTCWPKAGSIEYINGMIVIKISE